MKHSVEEGKLICPHDETTDATASYQRFVWCEKHETRHTACRVSCFTMTIGLALDYAAAARCRCSVGDEAVSKLSIAMPWLSV